MSLLPDPAELDALADRIGRHAAATRARALRLGGAVAAADWTGLAADAFHAEAHVSIVALRAAAGRLDAAADALRRHARRVGVVCDDLGRFGVDGLHTLGDAIGHPDRLLDDGKRLASDTGRLAGDALHVLGL